MTTTTTTLATTTTTVSTQPAGEPNPAAETFKEYGDTLNDNLINARLLGGCSALVEQMGVELAALTTFTLDFFKPFGSGGWVDVASLQQDATLLSRKWRIYESMLDGIIEHVGGGAASYAALLSEDVEAVATALAAWAFFDIDEDAETVKWGQLEDFGFTEHLATSNSIARA